MTRGVGGDVIQGFPVAKSTDAMLDSTSGASVALHSIFCVEDGELVITWPDSETPKTVTFVSGDCLTFPFGVTVDFSATTGIFHKG